MLTQLWLIILHVTFKQTWCEHCVFQFYRRLHSGGLSISVSHRDGLKPNEIMQENLELQRLWNLCHRLESNFQFDSSMGLD